MYFRFKKTFLTICCPSSVHNLCAGFSYFWLLHSPSNHNAAVIWPKYLPLRRKTLYNQSINQSNFRHTFGRKEFKFNEDCIPFKKINSNIMTVHWRPLKIIVHKWTYFGPISDIYIFVTRCWDVYSVSVNHEITH